MSLDQAKYVVSTTKDGYPDEKFVELYGSIYDTLVQRVPIFSRPHLFLRTTIETLITVKNCPPSLCGPIVLIRVSL
jgi:hypothetical protein